jgi:plasmid maintenance system antidote protein VapI
VKQEIGEPTTAADIRAAIARRRPRLHLYEVAARIHLHPVSLSAILNERRPLDPALAERILRVIESTGATR